VVTDSGNQISVMMERITCLQSIFSRKNKVKVAAADRVGTFKFGVEESSEKTTTRFEESHAFHEEEASPLPPTLQTEMTTTHDDMSGGPRAPLLITVPSMGDWGKDGGTVCFFCFLFVLGGGGGWDI
jgi:hypothetical protein